MITPQSRKKQETYSDFFKDLTLSPVNNDVARKVDEDSIKESIKNLVLTDRGERLFQPNLGCDIRKILFENITPDTIIVAREMIMNTLKAYEPRAAIIGVDIRTLPDEHTVIITIVFNVINKEEPVTLNITLERVR